MWIDQNGLMNIAPHDAFFNLIILITTSLKVSTEAFKQ